MKSLIINKTDLSYRRIGEIMDLIIKEGKEDTIYYGKVEWSRVKAGDIVIDVQIRYLKRYVEWIFKEVKI